MKKRKEVGRVLRVFRIANSMTVFDAAAATGLPTITIREIEAGLVKIGFSEATKLNRAYKLCHTCFLKLFSVAEARGAGSQAGQGASAD